MRNSKKDVKDFVFVCYMHYLLSEFTNLQIGISYAIYLAQMHDQNMEWNFLLAYFISGH